MMINAEFFITNSNYMYCRAEQCSPLQITIYKKRDDLSVIAETINPGNITESSLKILSHIQLGEAKFSCAQRNLAVSEANDLTRRRRI